MSSITSGDSNGSCSTVRRQDGHEVSIQWRKVPRGYQGSRKVLNGKIEVPTPDHCNYSVKMVGVKDRNKSD